MDKKAVKKLERFLTTACDQAIKEGNTICSRVYHPTDTSFDPVYAACRKEREAAKKERADYLPQYEEIISRELGQTFTFHDLRSYLNGFDTDEPYNHPVFDRDVKMDHGIFEMARRLRVKYILSKKQDHLKQTWPQRFQQLKKRTLRWMTQYVEL